MNLQGVISDSMTRASELTRIAPKAIAANWGVRNVRVFSDDARHARIKRQRRIQLREWIIVQRFVSDPANLPYIQARLRDSGPLMAHDLRYRVIMAKADRMLQEAEMRAL